MTDAFLQFSMVNRKIRIVGFPDEIHSESAVSIELCYAEFVDTALSHRDERIERRVRYPCGAKNSRGIHRPPPSSPLSVSRIITGPGLLARKIVFVDRRQLANSAI
jgi:hypothetical protein